MASTKNGELKSINVIAGSHKKVWWQCSHCEHEWQAVVESRALYRRGCPACSNKVCVIGKNDLQTTHPELAKEWHPTENGNLKPTNVTVGYDKRVWWICPKCKGKWQAHIYARTGKDRTGCPYCAGQKVLPGFNDLTTVNPRLAREWHPTKNGDLKPSNIYMNSHQKVWGKCPIGHEYQATVNQRNYAHTNCPKCHSRKSTSFSEQAIFYYVKKLWPNSSNRYKDCFKNKMEFDIYIPELKIAIEYDGIRGHKTDHAHKKETKKYEFCKMHEIRLIRVKEITEQSWNDTADENYYVPEITKRNFQTLEPIIRHLLVSIGNCKQATFEVNIEKNKNEILNYLSKVENSLAEKRPDVAAKWNYEKNGNLTPDKISFGSGEVVWWKCPDCKHEFKKSVNHMTTQNNGCPICRKVQQVKTFAKSIIEKRGSLAKKMPELALEWHPTKNGDLKPTDITTGSVKKVWWKCLKCGYEWQTTIADRSSRHRGCPQCRHAHKNKQLELF